MPTPPNTTVQSLVRLLTRIDARLSALEAGARTGQLQHASLTGTAIRVYDEDGITPRGAIGIQPDGTIGLVATGGPAPGAPTAPAVEPSLGGLRITWDGALADGSDLPADFDHVAVHVSTTDDFEPDATTYAGTITRAGSGGMLPVTPLPYEQHYVRLVGLTTSATAGPASEQTAATPLRVDGPDLEAGSVTAASIAAGAVEADKLAAVLALVTRIVAGDPAGARVELNSDGLRVYNGSGVLTVQFDGATGDAVFTGTITGSEVSGGTVTGATVQTATAGARIVLDTAKLGIHDASDTLVAEITPDDGSDRSAFRSYDSRFGSDYYGALTAGDLRFGLTGVTDLDNEAFASYSSLGDGLYELLLSSGRDTGTASAEVSLLSETGAGTADDEIVLHANTVTATGALRAKNLAVGRVTITPSAANTPTSMTVTGLTLTDTPRVVATASSSVPGTQVLGVGVTAASSTGFTMWLTRTNTTATGIDWTAYA